MGGLFLGMVDTFWMQDVGLEEMEQAFSLGNVRGDISHRTWSGNVKDICSALGFVQSEDLIDPDFEENFVASEDVLAMKYESVYSKRFQNKYVTDTTKISFQSDLDNDREISVQLCDTVYGPALYVRGSKEDSLKEVRNGIEAAHQASISVPSISVGGTAQFVARFPYSGKRVSSISALDRSQLYSIDVDYFVTECAKMVALGLFGLTDESMYVFEDDSFSFGNLYLDTQTPHHVLLEIYGETSEEMGSMFRFPPEVYEIMSLRAREIAIFLLATVDEEWNRVEDIGLRQNLRDALNQLPAVIDDTVDEISPGTRVYSYDDLDECSVDSICGGVISRIKREGWPWINIANLSQMSDSMYIEKNRQVMVD